MIRKPVTIQLDNGLEQDQLLCLFRKQVNMQAKSILRSRKKN